MQQTNYTNYHFLRGRQTTDSNGLVTFNSIFPGWYQSRATHIHVHIYTSSGASLLITQIAFPEGSGSAVETVNNATSYGYTKGMSGYTYNASDNVFSDGTSNQMSTITGSLSSGYVLNWETYVSAPVVATGISSVSAESQFSIRGNYPNPCQDVTHIPLVLRESSDVSVVVRDLQGREVSKQVTGTLSSGEQIVDLSLHGLSPGRYIYQVKISNSKGSFQQAAMLIKN